MPSNGNLLLYGSDIREAHGNDIHLRCILIMRGLRSIAEMDPRIMSLTLVIFLFSKRLTNVINFQEPLLANRQQILRAQNLYTEQLWIFLEQHYGFTRAVRTFTTIMSKCLLIDALFRDIQQDISEKMDPQQVPPIMRTLVSLS